MAQDSNAALRIVFGADTGQLEKAMSDLQQKLKNTGRQLTKVGKNLTKNVTAPLAAIGAVSAKTAIDFEFSMAKVAAVSGFANSEMQALTESAQHVGAITAFSATEVAQLQLELAKLGFDAGQIENMTEGVLSLAQAFDLELGDAAEKLALNLNRFGLEATESGRVADVMAKAFGSSALDAEKLEEALKVSGPTAASLGFTLEEVTGILGVLANAGVSGSIAGTQLTTIFAQMAKEGKDVKSEFAKLLNGTNSVKESFDRFGARGAKIVPVLQENSDEIGNLTDELLNSAGAATEARKKMEQTTKGAIKRLSSAMEAAAISIGNALIPAINSLVRFVTGLVDKFNGLSDTAKGIIVVVGAIAASIGPLLVVAGQLAIAASALAPVFAAVAAKAALMNAALLANPYLLATAGAVALVAVLANLLKTEEEVLTIEQEVNALRAKAEKNADNEAAKVSALVKLYKESAEGSILRRTALQDLQQIAPGYFGDLDLEKTKLEDVTKAFADYNREAKKAAVQKAFGDRLVELETAALKAKAQLTELGVAIPNLTGEEVEGFNFNFAASREDVERFLNDTGFRMTQAGQEFGQSIGGDFGAGLLKGLYDGQEELDTITAQMGEALADIGDAGGGSSGASSGGGASKTIKQLKYDVDDLGKAMQKLSDAELDIASQFALDSDTLAKTEALQAAYAKAAVEAAKFGDIGLAQDLQDQADEYASAASEAERFAKANDKLADTMQGLGYGTNLANLSVGQLLGTLDEYEVKTDKVTKTTEGFTSGQDAFVGSLVGSAKNLTSSFAELFRAIADGEASVGEAMGKIASQIISAAFAAASAQQITNAVLTASAGGPTAAIIAPALIASGLALVGGLFAALPSFATGGMVVGPQLALVGDNPSGREAIIPFERMGEFLNMAGVGGQNVQVTGRLQGMDLLLSNQRATLARNRTT